MQWLYSGDLLGEAWRGTQLMEMVRSLQPDKGGNLLLNIGPDPVLPDSVDTVAGGAAAPECVYQIES